MMKKVLSVFLAALIIFAMIPTVFAAPSIPKITATADKTTVKVGDTVTITVKVPANSNLVSLAYNLKYDSSYFQIVKGSTTVNGTFSAEMTNENIAGEFRYIGATGTSVTTTNTLFTVKFKILKTGGKITCDIDEAYVLSGGADVDVTSACAATSTKSLTFSGASVSPTDYFELKTPSEDTIKYKCGIILHAKINKTYPSTAEFRWSANNENFKLEPSADGKTCKIVSQTAGETTITVELVSSAGQVLDSDTVTMTSKVGFFDRIIAFFRSLFGIEKVIPE